MSVLDKIAVGNKARLSNEVLERIADGASGDLRAAVSDLETHVKRGHLEEIVKASRDIRHGSDATLKRFFMSADPAIAREIISDSDLDYESLLLWVEENIQLHFLKPHELENGLDGLSLADLALGRIMQSQNWKLLSYFFDFMASNVAMSRSETPYRKVEYERPSWPLLIWRGNRSRDREADALAALTNKGLVSRNRAKRTHLDTIHQLVKVNPGSFKLFAEWLDVDKKSLKQRKG